MLIKRFINETISEFKSIEWPARREVLVLSLMVVLISGVISLYLGLFDVVFTTFLSKINIL